MLNPDAGPWLYLQLCSISLAARRRFHVLSFGFPALVVGAGLCLLPCLSLGLPGTDLGLHARPSCQYDPRWQVFIFLPCGQQVTARNLSDPSLYAPSSDSATHVE
jgi:hypothetical protein